jgi:type IX secretion system PorP/SprF family membrane protein
MNDRFLMGWLLLSGIMITGRQVANAQIDPHFSQYYIQPMLLNPALTGAIEGDFRVASVWRSQYAGTLTTQGLSGEAVTNKNTNFGFNLLDEQSADKSYNFMNGYFTMAYTGVRLGPRQNHFIVLAAQWGFLNRHFDVSKMQFGDQWSSALGYDPNIASGESFVKPSVTSFDAGVGIAYYDATPEKTASLFGGFSAVHLNRPANPILSGDAAATLPIRYSFHAGVRIIESEYFTIVPTVIYMKEGSAEEKAAGAYLQIYASDDVDVMLGANWRWDDAFCPFAGFYYKGLTVGVSYDANISPGEAVVANNGSFEVTLSYVFQKINAKTKKFYCPRF